ncbi:hypothetical protein TIFTF001_001720 [Ficus carica]|uniref:Cardiolipin synthase N-terminal domain-containing protein n=1 Tax=Ficus carica TaxID=3494 RepID=A0AA87ZJD1_FICCA|nr:hypothetical protein TIFTF001_001720 [Ficus carica]
MLAKASLISCNFSSSSPLKSPKPRNSLQPRILRPTTLLLPKTNSGFWTFFTTNHNKASNFFPLQQKGRLQICHSTLNSQNPEDPVESEAGKSSGNVVKRHVFLEKATEFEGGRRFPNESSACGAVVHNGFVAIGVQQAAASNSSKSNVAVWPFIVFSFFGGVYALLPYFVLWKPPPPPVEEPELSRWPLNFLESKLTAGISLAAGLGIIAYAGLADRADWKEFFQYFRESRFIHVTCLDFTLLSAFAPFWVYNDMTARKWFDKGSWLLPLSLVPFFGPALYILLRPPLPTLPASVSSTTSEPK